MDENAEIAENSDIATVDLVALTAEIVSAYAANNSVPGSEMAALIASTHAALSGLGKAEASPATATNRTPPAQVRKSISHDALISFEDGKPYKTLKRHLTGLGLTPEAYREKWGLPPDYPMVAASYSEARSALAKSIGVGHQRGKAASGAATKTIAVADATSAKPKRGARTRKSGAQTTETGG